MCPKPTTIAKLIHGHLPAPKAKKIRKHLHKCSACKEMYDREQNHFLKIKALMVDTHNHLPKSHCLLSRDFLFLMEEDESPRKTTLENHLLQCKKCRDDYGFLKATEELADFQTPPMPSRLLKKLKSKGSKTELATETTVPFSSASWKAISIQKGHRSSLRKRAYTKKSSSFPLGWIMGMAASLLFLAMLILNNIPSSSSSHVAKAPRVQPVQKPSPAPVLPQKPDKPGTLPQTPPATQPQIPPTTQPETPIQPRPIFRPTPQPIRPQHPSTRPTKAQPVHTKTVVKAPMTVACLKGSIWIKKPRGSFKEVKSQKEKMLVGPQDRLKIGKTGALLAFGGNNILCAKKNSLLSFQRSNQGSSVYLHKGTIFAAFQRQNGQIPQVKTAQALCTVQGTEFQVESRGKTVTYLTVAYGAVNFTSRKTGESKVVRQGQKAWITPSKGPYVRTVKRDVAKVIRWTWKLRPSTLVQYKFDYRGQDSPWRGWIVNNITYKNSLGALRAIVTENNPFWGVRVYLDRQMFSFRAHREYVVRFAYHTNTARAILIQIYNANQRTFFHYKLLKPKVDTWAILEVPLSKFKAYHNKNLQISYGDVMEQIEIYSATPKTKNQIRLFIDDFTILRHKVKK